MNSALNLTSGEVAGIYELDTSGTVLYTRKAHVNESFEKRADLIGQNFFEEVAGFENVNDFQRRFKNFVNSRQPAENFLFECRFADQIVPVRVMMMRARETNETETSDIVIIDIRKNGA